MGYTGDPDATAVVIASSKRAAKKVLDRKNIKRITRIGAADSSETERVVSQEE